jgi:hypothetical protein
MTPSDQWTLGALIATDAVWLLACGVVALVGLGVAFRRGQRFRGYVLEAALWAVLIACVLAALWWAWPSGPVMDVQ